MGQKVNPHGLRVGVIKDWDSRWFADKSTFGDTLVEDYNIRKYILKKLNTRSKNPANKTVYAGVPKVEIERFADSEGGQKIKVHVHCAKPGLVIGKGGAEIEKLRGELEKMTGKKVSINIVEVKQPDINAQLVAEKDRSRPRRQSFLPPCNEAVHRTCNEAWRKGNKDKSKRPSWRS